MVEAVARCSRLIADGGRSEKERDAEGGGESGEGSSTVLYIVLGARQTSALGDAKPGRGGGLQVRVLPIKSPGEFLMLTPLCKGSSETEGHIRRGSLINEPKIFRISSASYH